MVSLPQDLLAEIDREAARRSPLDEPQGVLAAAARRELARPDPEHVAAAIARSQQRFDDAGSFESEDLVRRDRDSRG